MGLSDLAISYLYKDDFKMSPAEVAIASSFISFPWVVKPLWGVMTDTMPFFGYRRKSYLIMFGMFGFLLWQSMAKYISTKYMAFFALFLINICIAFCNVIGEALIVEISQKKAK